MTIIAAFIIALVVWATLNAGLNAISDYRLRRRIEALESRRGARHE
jgi:hypothetical protein